MRAVVLFLLMFSTSLASQTTHSLEIVQSARAAVELLENADYEGVVTLFSPRLREKLPEKNVRQIWEDVHRKAGRLQRTGDPTTTVKDNLRRVIVPGEFERSNLDIEVVFNAEGQIAGLLLHRK
jgi:Protein of unknown function (DUF3887)